MADWSNKYSLVAATAAMGVAGTTAAAYSWVMSDPTGYHIRDIERLSMQTESYEVSGLQ